MYHGPENIFDIGRVLANWQRKECCIKFHCFQGKGLFLLFLLIAQHFRRIE